MTELVTFRGAGKRYRQHIDAAPLAGGSRRGQRDAVLWALRDLDLTLRAGESLGVLGRNGAGKSTMLALLAGVTAPSEGTVSVRGRVAPLLSVGVGFHPEMTGRENVFVNAKMLGLDGRAAAARLDDIVDFAGLGAFLDTPVKYYSSGMYARLGFAVASSVTPDLLIIDEVLSVGDYDFQSRSFDRMRELRDSGVAVVLVSHNALALQAFCERGVVLSKGRKTFEGTIEQAVTHYGDDAPAGIDEVAAPTAVRITRVDGGPADHVPGGDTVRVHGTLDVAGLARPAVEVTIRKDHLVVHRRRLPLAAATGQTRIEVLLSLRLPLVTGTYALSLGAGELSDSQPLPASADQLVRVNSGRELHGILDLQAQLLGERATRSP